MYRILLVIGGIALLLAIGAISCIGYMAWGAQHAEQQLDRSVEGAWTRFTRWDILDAAIRTYGGTRIDGTSLHLDVPLADQIEMCLVQDDRIVFGYGGGFHHCGITYFLDPRKAVPGEDETGASRKLSDKVIFYSER